MDAKTYLDKMKQERDKCRGCGYCCIKSPCPVEIATYGYRTSTGRRSCPWLYWSNKENRYKCKAIELHNFFRKNLFEGEGCCSNMNCWRKQIIPRRGRDTMLETKMDMTPYMKDFRIDILDGFMGKERCIFYKDVAMLRCGSPNLDVLKFLVLGGDPIEKGSKKMESYCIAVYDEMQDYYTYGDWDTLDELKAWLENPTKLY